MHQRYIPEACALSSVLQLPQWVPLSVVKGGQAANILVQSLETGWGMKLFGNTLVRNIGQVVYKVSSGRGVCLSGVEDNNGSRVQTIARHPGCSLRSAP